MKTYIKPASTIYKVELNAMLCMSYSEGNTTAGNSITSAEVNEERQFDDGSNLWGKGW